MNLDLINEVQKYQFDIGLFENENKEEEVKILNTDGTETKIKLPLNEILYFTENGTLTIPKRPILFRCERWAKNFLEAKIPQIIQQIISGDITSESEIKSYMVVFQFLIEQEIKQIARNIIKENSYLSDVLQINDDNKYIFDLDKLADYLKCRLIKI